PGGDCCARGHDDIRNVWSQLDDHWNFRDFHDPASDLLAILRDLADGAAHAALAHTVRAAIVQLNTVSSSVLNAANNVMPSLRLGFHHCGNNHSTIGPGPFYLRNLPKIHLHGPIGNEFDVVYGQHSFIAVA